MKNLLINLMNNRTYLIRRGLPYTDMIVLLMFHYGL